MRRRLLYRRGTSPTTAAALSRLRQPFVAAHPSSPCRPPLPAPQAFWRGHSVRSELSFRAWVRTCCAAQIQAAWRGHRARKELPERLRREAAAALVIQARPAREHASLAQQRRGEGSGSEALCLSCRLVQCAARPCA